MAEREEVGMVSLEMVYDRVRAIDALNNIERTEESRMKSALLWFAELPEEMTDMQLCDAVRIVAVREKNIPTLGMIVEAYFRNVGKVPYNEKGADLVCQEIARRDERCMGVVMAKARKQDEIREA